MKRRQTLGLAAGLLLVSSRALAGGMEIPDNGTEALGRGGAFAAKADDPTALHHNVGGLAQQRGTRVLFNANVARSSLSFQREGTYPGDPSDPTTPWAGKAYPRAENEGGVAILPLAAVTSDLGTDRATFALGTIPPSSIGGRVYPLVKDGMPGPARYDSIGGLSSLVLFHTAAVGYKVSDAIDIGVAVHLVQASIGTRMLAYMSNLGNCAEAPEQTTCDARGEATTTGWSATGSLGALVRPGNGIAIGAHVRGPTYLNTEGMAKLTPPNGVTMKLEDTRVLLQLQLPWVFRAGIRKAFGRRPADPSADAQARLGGNEEGDIELDATYETWGSAMNPGPRIVLEKMPTVGKAERISLRGYNDTFSVRAGGSYVTTAGGVPVTLRGGAYFDSSATAPQFTRIDTDTLAKVGLTVGAGVRAGAVRFDVAYASVFGISRTVESGEVRSTANAPAVNEGHFASHTHIASLGVTVELDMLLGKVRLPKPEGDRVARVEEKKPAPETEATAANVETVPVGPAPAPVAEETSTEPAPRTEAREPAPSHRIATRNPKPRAGKRRSAR